MKCISLWQPWASLVAIGAKTIETRSWHTPHVGPIAIHAAKFYSMETAAFAQRKLCAETLRAAGLDWARLPRGAIIAVAQLDGCMRVERLHSIQRARCPELDTEIAATLRFAGKTEEEIDIALNEWQLTDRERAFGDYSPGRFAWLLADVRRLDEPVPCVGRQGLFNVKLPDGVE